MAVVLTLSTRGEGSPDTDRTLDVGSRISGMVSGGFDTIGYIPMAKAVDMCEGQARFR